MDISYETARRWFPKFGEPTARNMRSSRPTPNDIWHLDEMVIVIRGKRYFLSRAVDSEDEVLDFPVQPRRNANTALKLMKKLLKKQGFAPTQIVTDKLKSYHKAFRLLELTAERIDNKRESNRAKIFILPFRQRERIM
jgi:putative transposase